MPRPRRPHRASPDEIRTTRDGDYAIIAYADDAVATTHFKIGSEQLAQMTDEQIIDFWNDGIDARDRFMAAQDVVALEFPWGNHSSSTRSSRTNGYHADTSSRE